MNFVELQDEIKAKPELIENVLDKLGYINVRDKGSYFAGQNPDGNNSGALCIYKDSLQYNNYTRGHSGSLISLVMNDKKCSFPKALEYISDWTGIKPSNIIIVPPFGGFYKNMTAEKQGKIPELQVYDESLLPEENNFSLKWLTDGVDLITQKKFGIRYDFNSDGIVIPEYTIDGSLCGAKWRNADPNCAMDERWNMYLRFNQSHNLYGCNINYVTIQKKSKVVILEAEKSVQHLYSWGCGLGVSVNGHNISKVQSTLINSLMPSETIIAFDHDVCEEEVRYCASHLKIDNAVYKNKISYIYDKEGLLGAKDSPTDRGKKVFQELFKRRIAI